MLIKKGIKVVFAGTSEFALPALQALYQSEHEIVAVYTKVDKPAGRGRKLTASPIKQFAQQHELVIYQPESLKSELEQQIMRNLQADIMVDVAYGLYLPAAVLQMFKLGCINIHPSLLPKWRGAAPIQRAILAGDTKTGVTIMQVDAGWDTGDILLQEEINIKNDDTTGSLSEVLAQLGAKMMLEVLQMNKLNPKKQDDAKSCYADKINKQEAELDWNLSAPELDRAIRAFNPSPIAFSILNGQAVRILEAVPLTAVTVAHPGTIIATTKKHIDVATGNGILRLLKLQLPGGRVLSSGEILNSKREMFKLGKCFNA